MCSSSHPEGDQGQQSAGVVGIPRIKLSGLTFAQSALNQPSCKQSPGEREREREERAL